MPSPVTAPSASRVAIPVACRACARADPAAVRRVARGGGRAGGVGVPQPDQRQEGQGDERDHLDRGGRADQDRPEHQRPPHPGVAGRDGHATEQQGEHHRLVVDRADHHQQGEGSGDRQPEGDLRPPTGGAAEADQRRTDPGDPRHREDPQREHAGPRVLGHLHDQPAEGEPERSVRRMGVEPLGGNGSGERAGHGARSDGVGIEAVGHDVGLTEVGPDVLAGDRSGDEQGECHRGGGPADTSAHPGDRGLEDEATQRQPGQDQQHDPALVDPAPRPRRGRSVVGVAGQRADDVRRARDQGRADHTDPGDDRQGTPVRRRGASEGLGQGGHGSSVREKAKR